MFGEKKYAALATIVGLAILSAVAVPALIESSAAAQITPTEQGAAGNETSTSSPTTDGNNSFSSSVNISPTADSNTNVTIEGNGLTAKQMNINQERQADGTIKITIEGVFAVGNEATPAAPSGGVESPGQLGNNETITTPPAPSSNETSTIIPPANETALPPKLAPLAGVFPSSGAAGSQVNISGSGFPPNQALTLSFDGSSLDAGSATTDNIGTFSAAATIPADAASGDHQVKVTDSTGASTTATFTVVESASSTGQTGNQTGNETAMTQSNATATVPPENEMTTSSIPLPTDNETTPTIP